MKSYTEKIILSAGILIYILLATFSYSYVDLNLTLSQNRTILLFIKSMQSLGYYNRPLSTVVFISIITILFGYFMVNLILASKQKLTIKYIFRTTIILTTISIIAYPFLSSDIFNYMFDAKIIFHYHLNPYAYKALDFPQDTWIRFMRWTHRYSPYGPVWLLFSLIPYALGFGKFILTLFTFKIFIGSFHLLNTFLIYRILQKYKPSMVLIGTTTYSLNPLFLVEGVVNAHNDVVLAAFILLPIYFFLYEKTLNAFGTFLLGILIKYIPVLLLPWGLLYVYSKSKFSINKIVILSLLTLGVFTYLFSSIKITVPFVSSGATQIQFQPWYLFWTLPLAALIPNIWLITTIIAFSMGATLRYLPYLYYGDWSHQGVTQFMTLVTFIPFVITISLVIVIRTIKSRINHGKEI